MSILSTLVFGKQKCLNCGQASSPKENEGDWEILGLYNGNSISQCEKCKALQVITLIGSRVLTEKERNAFFCDRKIRSKQQKEMQKFNKVVSEYQNKMEEIKKAEDILKNWD